MSGVNGSVSTSRWEWITSNRSRCSQTFDSVFHLNALRYVLETGNASSMTITGMTNGDNPPYFYPAAWHGLASLLIQITGLQLPAAVNVLNLCVAMTVWTLGCMAGEGITAGAAGRRRPDV